MEESRSQTKINHQPSKGGETLITWQMLCDRFLVFFMSELIVELFEIPDILR